MKFKNRIFTGTLLFTLFFLLMSCAPKLKFYVTRPPLLPIHNVKTLSIGHFENLENETIPYPGSLKGRRLNHNSSLRPAARTFDANSNAAGIVRATLVAGLSKSGQYQLIDTGGAEVEFSGSIPDPVATGEINAKIKYYEFEAADSEKMFYLLLATKGGLSLQETALLMAGKQGIIYAAQRGNKGFMVDTPYVEKIAAMEVEFDLIRKSNGEDIIQTQRFIAYYTSKSGGRADTSHLPKVLKQTIITKFQQDDSLFKTIQTQVKNIERALLDPDEYLALGGKLSHDGTVPRNFLDIRTQLAQNIVGNYLKQISNYTEETELKVASGDSIAVNYLNGNAYEMAINRLENIDREQEDSFNLGLAYEAIAEYTPAAKYYREALDKDPENNIYKNALNRVRQ